MIEPAWREACAWRLRTPELDRLRVNGGYPMVPVFEIGGDAGAWTSQDVRPHWMKLAAHPNMLAAVEPTTAGISALYAPLAWQRGRSEAQLTIAKWGRQIVDDYAQRALAIDGAHAPALETLVAAMLAKHWHEEALRNAERLVELVPSRGRAQYLRGKALFVNGRMLDARDAFERATSLDPQLLEAQLLRREVERVTGNVRQTVGRQHAPTFEIPDQLAELRDVLVSGDTRAAITALGAERYASDADAQLLLARLLAFDRRFDAAFAVYDQLTATSHRTTALVGKATALLELGRPGDALALCEQLPDEADAVEVAARALAALGRFDDAREAYRRFIAIASSGSELRVRAAQLALDDVATRRRP